MTSLVIVFIIGVPLIRIFSEKMITGPIRQDGPIDHIVKKSGTPTMWWSYNYNWYNFKYFTLG